MPSSILLFLHLGVGQIQFRRNHSGCRIFWHLFTQFSLSRTSPPSSPRLTSTADNLGAELFFWKSLNLIIIENTNRSFFINRSSSTKTSVFSSFTDTYLKPPVWFPLRPSVGPRPLPSLPAWNDVEQKILFGYFLVKEINTYAAKLKWKWMIYTSSLPSMPFFSWS